ncbi:MAG: response regulator [Lachnospiraceae bacterium]|nr:response regulator [Lachnospiraceae bacterium]
MELLKLVIVDDEMILLQGLLETYEWNEMGFEVVGAAMNGEQAIQVIEETRPHVVLTDIRMKQISGLVLMEEIQSRGMDCLFIVLSAYRDFEYAKKACDLGAFAYLLKPIEDDKLMETMQGAYEKCMDWIKRGERYKKMEKLISEDSTNFLSVMIHKYTGNLISTEQMLEIFESIGDVPCEKDKFVTVCVDMDIVYKITDFPEYEKRYSYIFKRIEEMLGNNSFWKFENENGNMVFIIRTRDNGTVHKLKDIIEEVGRETAQQVVAAISRPHSGVEGIRQSFEEASQRFGMMVNTEGTGPFRMPEDGEKEFSKKTIVDAIVMVVNAVRKNSAEDLKENFVSFIYELPGEEKKQCAYIHRAMLSVDNMLMESYGMTEELRKKFEKYYLNLTKLKPAQAVDVCYKILKDAVEIRENLSEEGGAKNYNDYMSEALSYIEEHLDDENLSIVSVASHIYLNPVYFGRVFKNTLNMTFKAYLMKQRMEKAKRLLEEGDVSIGDICARVGIGNPSYFTHLFKQYAGKLPSEYKKEYEV